MRNRRSIFRRPAMLGTIVVTFVLVILWLRYSRETLFYPTKEFGNVRRPDGTSLRAIAVPYGLQLTVDKWGSIWRPPRELQIVDPTTKAIVARRRLGFSTAIHIFGGTTLRDRVIINIVDDTKGRRGYHLGIWNFETNEYRQYEHCGTYRLGGPIVDEDGRLSLSEEPWGDLSLHDLRSGEMIPVFRAKDSEYSIGETSTKSRKIRLGIAPLPDGLTDWIIFYDPATKRLSISETSHPRPTTMRDRP